MESSTINAVMKQAPAGHALIEILIELGVAACSKVSKALAQSVKARNMARVREEMHGMSDHYLADIGLHRGDIDRMFR